MKIQLRYVIAILFVIAVLLAAQGGTAWAGRDAAAPQAGDQAGSGGLEQGDGRGGSVRPPPPKTTITHPGYYTVGGCVLRVLKLGPGDAIYVEYITGFQRRVKMDQDDPRFLVGTCLVTHTENGKVVEEMPDPEHGTVYICFAAPQQAHGRVHAYGLTSRTWTHRPTTYEVYDKSTGTWRPATEGEAGFTCGQSNLTGYYLVAGQ